MKSIAILSLLFVMAACSGTSVAPSILDSVHCERDEEADALAGLDVWEDTIAGFERADAEAPPEAGQVVFIGSSSIVFWATLAADVAPVSAINRGFGGSATRQATGYVDRVVLPYDPSAVVVYEGDNDIAFGISADCVLRDMEQFVDAVRSEKSDLPVYILAVKPSIARAHLWSEAVRANALFEALATSDENVTFIDVATPMFDAEGNLRRDLFIEDGLHMNAKGYAIWASTVRPVLLAHSD